MLRRISSNNRIAFTVRGASLVSATQPAATLDGAWHHYAGVWDGATVRLFVDGVEVASAAQASPMRVDDGPVCLGSLAASATACGGTSGKPWAGDVDDVSIWNRALNAAEIQALMPAELSGGEAGLAGYWRLNEGSGQAAADSSASGFNGVLGSTPAVDLSDPAWLGAIPPP